MIIADSSPRAIVEVSGVDVHWTDLSTLRVENTLYMAADSFEAAFDNSRLLSDWFRKEQEVKIYLGYVKDPNHWSKSELTHVFTGKVDGVKPNFGNPNLVTLIGRDYSARMIDTQNTIAFKNQKSGQVAQYFAKKYGLKFVGQMGEADLDQQLIVDKKEWDVLQALADREGFICYVDKDKNLYFGPRQEADEKSIATFSRVPGKVNCAIEYDDSSVGVITKVTVKHWYKKKLIQASSENKSLSARVGQVKERVVYDSKAKTPAAAKATADKRLKEWSREVVTGRVTSVMMPQVVAEKKVTTQGTGRFDGLYYVDNIVHNISKSGATSETSITNLRPDDAEQYRTDLYDIKRSTVQMNKTL
ncbi:hypothetical protein PP175_05655 [Aneurinibacillus sp. Ricciae_BoGa-3]|uniref:phage late control D family protein n=1 Tax=Aneurinibacillus sp. Ricciae_BoGa-3 TaxID=3022697 RepID=UPI00233FA170|nr:hypothetical protein [Aneurinibacillus sp. Ricciae_BoGa-3]WCK55436.1 hypothetical protein PP175_05655 [Aneurinibacillus sp. Ricciae_BoGa-3]